MDGYERVERSKANVRFMERLVHLARTGAAEEFAATLHETAASWRGRWPWCGRMPSFAVRQFEAAAAETARSELESRLRQAVPDASVSGYTLDNLVSVYPLLLTGSEALGHARETLAVAGRKWVCGADTDVVASVLLLRSQGEPIPVSVVATLRRETSVARYWPEFADLVSELEGPLLNPGEPWADEVLGCLENLDPRWRELIAHLGKATSAKPSARWLKTAAGFVEELGAETVGNQVMAWLCLVGEERTIPVDDTEYATHFNEQFDPHNVDYLRGLVWTLGLVSPDRDAIRLLADLVTVCQRKIPGVGVRSQLITNAAIHALSMIDDLEAVGQIARLATSVKVKPTLKALNKALDARAAALGITRDEVEEISVPTYELTRQGRRFGKLGETLWEIAVDSDGVKLLWRNDSGKSLKSPPAAVKREHPETVKDLKATVKDIAKMVSAQSERLDRQFLARREWPFTDWWERYAYHPLVGTVARRLIWMVDDVACCFADGDLRTVDGAVLEQRHGTTVRLWHPIGRYIDEVLAWRDFLERHGIVQPFKQAHREVYLLTAAEENTRVYSNRFAAHILKQHQYNSLAKARGWDNQLRLMVDDTYEPTTKLLPRWGLRAEFWVEGIGDDYGADTTEAGTYLRLASDQVRFYREDAPRNHAHATGGNYAQYVHDRDDFREPVPLNEIPPLVLSEVLRDVDLFVGVASVGNDPEWSDGGPEGRFQEYWHSYSFGELGATAVTRRDLLERLVPRLAIADRAEIDGKFLRVRGDLRTYKIHLGSGNILMEPNNEYLCIVPKQAGTGDGKVFLPFDGDRVLSLILSKALLLAKDTTITDRTITSQIRRG
ncbi:DUF4132 domain-containing protein [Stackebrandtia nassauensis]|uniref:Uncharacterized protein n=1 Tax=Stackebrandtia nassauensis (strain DSM 44728 / CIP 108903 / NRRL B-16338 / NBRC 102104 / LLR-40K-21) TaxID=446470 RepID=D3PZF7_STANL|nr:DUF4132 domain-containing protein [Stackebrandtia nassauensis]ADD41631.1 hypothetical protein Snas_1935 [Stackebrandtia nassauensis DSM 44728]